MPSADNFKVKKIRLKSEQNSRKWCAEFSFFGAEF